MNKLLAVGVMLLFLGLSVPALATTTYDGAKTTPLPAASSAENYTVYIGAGIHRTYEGKFGWGWHLTIVNNRDTNITGYVNETDTTLLGKVVSNGTGTFTVGPHITGSSGSVALLDFHPFEIIDITVQIENATYVKSGYMIGPFVLFTS